jgi:hypothetical protein
MSGAVPPHMPICLQDVNKEKSTFHVTHRQKPYVHLVCLHYKLPEICPTRQHYKAYDGMPFEVGKTATYGHIVACFVTNYSKVNLVVKEHIM